ncbi:hypothetical protein N0V82_005563 [Gnomoniopsis sp. IMI 355080]|nr:hypothetical protein N0V82_005563 [Gnomoniopsis sp. IMI 355080]
MDTAASVSSVFTTAYTVIEFFISVASADKDCKKVVQELYTVTSVIESIRSLAKENPNSLEKLNALLVPNGALDQFRHTIDELSTRILQSKGIKEAYKRVNEEAYQVSYGKIAEVVPPPFREAFEERTANDMTAQVEDVISSKMKLAKAWLESDEIGDWVLILDNVDDPNMLQKRGSKPSTLQRLPVRSKGRILATSRRKDVALGISGDENTSIHVDAFSQDEAVKCFKQLLPNDMATDDQMLSLAQERECLPLAIRQAASYISQESASIEVYSYLLASSETSEMVLLEQDFRDTMRADDVPNSVFRTWLLSFEQLRRQNEEAAKLLCLMATLDRSGVADFILKEVWKDPITFQANIGLVLAFSFIGVVGPDRKSYNMHRLIQLSTRTWMIRRGEKEGFDRIALSTILRLFEDAISSYTWSNCRTLLPHARSLVTTIHNDSELVIDKEKLVKLVEEFENPPLWQLSSQYNREAYRSLLAEDSLIDISNHLLDTPEFRVWLNGSRPLLVMYGRPGSGKTVACFSVVQNLQTQIDASGSRPIVAFFFFRFQHSGNTDTVKAMLLDIISQICEQLGPAHVPERVRTILSITDEFRSKSDLEEVVRDLCGNLDKPTFLILDGLDECGDRSSAIPEIINITFRLVNNSERLRILISTRAEARISELVKDTPTLDMGDHNGETIDEYLKLQLAKLGLEADQQC